MYQGSLGSKREYLMTIYERYQKVDRQQKTRILEEFCKVCGYCRDHAIRLLNRPLKEWFKLRKPRQRLSKYTHKTISILEDIWQVAGYPWSVRLKALLSVWMPWVKKQYNLDAKTQQELLKISPRQIDRRLRTKKLLLKKKRYGTTKPGTLLKHQIPIRTKNWDITKAGYLELDTVAHCGNSLEGNFIYTLDATDIQTTWTERAAVMGKGEGGILDGVLDIQKVLPFPLLGIDSDNGSEFINHHLYRFCVHSKPSIEFTRSRPYETNDNAHVEQKNWTHVRKILGWDRYDTKEVLESINDLYQNELRLWNNLFQPSVKCLKKIRRGSRMIRQYDSPKTPFQRILESPQADPNKVIQLKKLFSSLNPFELSKTIDQKLDRIYSMASQKLRKKKDFNPKMVTKDLKKPLRYSLKSPWRHWTFSPKLKQQIKTMNNKIQQHSMILSP
jgi:hypothetical protein